MTDRDTFAAAALTGLLANRNGYGESEFAEGAYRLADAMLRERGVTEPMTKEKRAEVSSAPVFADKTGSWPVSYEKSDEKRVLYDTNHDAAPEAKAGAERPMSVGAAQSPSESDAQHPSAATLPQPGGGHGTGNTTLDGAPAAEAGAGKPLIAPPQAGKSQTALPCVETDGPPSQGEGLHIPDSRTRLSEAEIDALEYVVEEGRVASMDDYGILRSLLVRVRPEWESESYEESDENRVNTNTNRDTTPSEGSVQGEGMLTDAERKALVAAIRLLEHSTLASADRTRIGLLSIYGRLCETA